MLCALDAQVISSWENCEESLIIDYLSLPKCNNPRVASSGHQKMYLLPRPTPPPPLGK
jgi:hypothetical protein